MKKLILAIALFGSTVHAASSGSAGGKVSDAIKALFRAGFGYGFSDVQNVEPGAVTEFNKPRSFWQETDFLLPFSIHLGLRHTYDDSAVVNFYGQGEKPAEIYMTAIQAGIKLTAPFWRIQPWFGGGATGGFIAVSDPTNRNSHDWKVAFDKITKAVRGLYWHAGVDVMTSTVGLRLGFMSEKIQTDRYSNLSDQALKFDHTMVMVGFVGNVK